MAKDENSVHPVPPAAPCADDETIEGLWTALLRYVPKATRPEAGAIASALHYFIGNEPVRTRRLAVDAAYREGFEKGTARGRADAEFEAKHDALNRRRAQLENDGIVSDDAPEPKEPTRH